MVLPQGRSPKSSAFAGWTARLEVGNQQFGDRYEMSWTDERIQELSRLWQAGHSASEIGKLLGVSKNAVVGKAHRLKLPSRPSPIKQQGHGVTGTESGGNVRAAAQAGAAQPGRGASAGSKPAAVHKPASGTAGVAAGGGQTAPAGNAPTPPAHGRADRSAPAARPAMPARVKAANSGPAGPGAGAKPAAGAATAARTGQPAGGRGERSRPAAQRQAVEARGSASGCLWPIGDPGDRDFHFCGAQAVPGKPYCAEHAARAYITRNRSERGEEAA
jgi:GcrA cell cycle regulator